MHGKNQPMKDIIRNDVKLAKDFLELNFPVGTPSTTHRMENASRYITTTDINSNDNDHPWNDKFTVSEMNEVLKGKKNTSPGIEGITYKMIQILPINLKEIKTR